MDIAQSSRRGLEREVLLQRNENQRLSRADIVAGVEVSSLKRRIQELASN